MFCPNCGRQLPDKSRFCSGCGQSVQVTPPPSSGDPARPGLSNTPPGATEAVPSAAAQSWQAASQAWPAFAQRVKNILLTPKTEWLVIEGETPSVVELYTHYVIPFAAFAALMQFIRLSVIGFGSVFGVGFRVPVGTGLTDAVVNFVFQLVAAYAVGFLIDVLAPTFNGQRNQMQSLKCAVYAFTPAWVASVAGLLGELGILISLAAAVYGAYLLYLGLPVMMKNPEDKSLGYAIAVFVCVLVLVALFGMLAGSLLGFRQF